MHTSENCWNQPWTKRCAGSQHERTVSQKTSHFLLMGAAEDSNLHKERLHLQTKEAFSHIYRERSSQQPSKTVAKVGLRLWHDWVNQWFRNQWLKSKLTKCQTGAVKYICLTLNSLLFPTHNQTKGNTRTHAHSSGVECFFALVDVAAQKPPAGGATELEDDMVLQQLKETPFSSYFSSLLLFSHVSWSHTNKVSPTPGSSFIGCQRDHLDKRTGCISVWESAMTNPQSLCQDKWSAAAAAAATTVLQQWLMLLPLKLSRPG